MEALDKRTRDRINEAKARARPGESFLIQKESYSGFLALIIR